MSTIALTLHLPDEAATMRLGAALASALLGGREGGAVFLEGELGAGKTTLARAFLRALGVQGPVRSPTYTLMEPYQAAGHAVLHLDLYRLHDPLELTQLGLGDYPVTRCWWLVEWPERGAGLLPPALLQIQLQREEKGRRASLSTADEALAQSLRSALQPLH